LSASIRIANLADAETLARLHQACFDEPWDADSFRHLLQRPGTFALLTGEDENHSQALILIQVAAGESEILSLGTHPASRRKGFAERLVREAAANAHRIGAGEMFLEVADDNAAALALYQRLGFARRGLRAGYYVRVRGRHADAVILRAALPL
jgi:ribosomal-protein-alanine N-acetyltransferase